MLKCWHYAQCFCLAIMLKIMLAYNVQKPTAAYYLFHYLFHISLTLISFTGTYEPTIILTCSQRPWLHSSVGRASHRYCEVTGSNPVEVLNFFQASLRNCINCVHCDNHFFILTIYKLVTQVHTYAYQFCNKLQTTLLLYKS